MRLGTRTLRLLPLRSVTVSNSFEKHTSRSPFLRTASFVSEGAFEANQGRTVDDGPTGTFTYPARSVCKATIVGRTGALPTLTEFRDGGSQLSFSVATSEVRMGEGANDTITQWNRVVVRERVPGFEGILKQLSPGSLVYVEGNLKISKRTGHNQYSEYASVIVSRSHGTFRVLQGPANPKYANMPNGGGTGRTMKQPSGDPNEQDLPF
jgi:single-stranded DNA-binding protein